MYVGVKCDRLLFVPGECVCNRSTLPACLCENKTIETVAILKTLNLYIFKLKTSESHSTTSKGTVILVTDQIHETLPLSLVFLHK